jgi:ABC-type multidrug transport system fused ATPase/permease subunit
MLTRNGSRKDKGFTLALGSALPRKFLTRAALLTRWLTRIVLPRYWKPLIGAMALMTVGALAEAASFLVAAHLLIDTAAGGEQALPNVVGNPLVLAGVLLVVLLLAGALCSYAGSRLAISAVLDFETISFAHAVGIARELEGRGTKLTAVQHKELLSSAPHVMGRTILQCVGLGTSAVLALVGAAVCVAVFPELSMLLGVILFISAPVFIYHTMHSTNVGHRARETASRHAAARKAISSKWLSREHFDPVALKAEAIGEDDYLDFFNAFGQRLMISPLSRLLVNSALAICIVTSLLWMAATLELNRETVGRLVVFLIFLRVFFTGIRSIITAVQVIASFVPYFLAFLIADPRMR